MTKGYTGEVLHVDLTSRRIEVERPSEAFYRTYMGGSSMGLFYLWKHTRSHCEPLDPDNTLSLMLGPLTGAPISGQSRVCATAKSPLTGLVGDSQSGGFWPAQLRHAGFDGIVIRGASKEPVYLWIEDGRAELRDATMLWGRVTGDVEDSIKEDLEDPDIQVLQCGPAAEKGVRYGALISSCNRANGRTGLGTVMAAKKLKAIAVRGHKSPELARPDLLKGLAKWGAEHFPQSDIADMRDLGTNVDNLSQNEAGGLPTRNWSRGAFDGIASLTGERIAETVRVGGGTCYACVVGCKQQMEVVEKPFTVDPRYGGAEYETVAMMGSLCGVSDMTAIARANQICNMYGMDTISCGATVAWAMDCYEQGLITKQTTGGIELRFGNAEALVKMVELIASREGFGHVLGEGSARASQVLGVGEELVVAVKGQELPGHMPQVKRSLALIYAVNPFGADHQSHEHDDSYCEDYLDRMATLGLLEPQSPEVLSAEKVRYTLYTQFLYGALDCLSVCQFVFGPSFQLYSPSQLVEAVRSATGWDVTLWELMKLGERRLNMQRAFNVREGVASEADELPAKLFTPLKGGASEGRALSKQEFYQARDLYYQMAGWDAQGIPLVSKLQELGVGWIGARMTEG